MKMTDCFVCGGKMWLKKSGDEEKNIYKEFKRIEVERRFENNLSLVGKVSSFRRPRHNWERVGNVIGNILKMKIIMKTKDEKKDY